MKSSTVEVISLAQAPMMTLLRLRDLTNSPHRGDLRDDGVDPGSVLLDRIERHIAGFSPFGPTDRAVVIRRFGHIVAWAYLTEVLFDKEGNFYERPTSACHVYVYPDFRRQGLGSDLIKASLTAAREFDAAAMVVYPWNTASHCFYEEHGFAQAAGRIVGKRWVNVVFSYDLTLGCNLQKAVVWSDQPKESRRRCPPTSP